jgi:hypothetical protein
MLDENQPPSGGFTGKPLIRYFSDQLKWIGFRYGAPIYRGTADFSIDDVWSCVRAGTGEEAKTFLFTTKIERQVIRLHVTSIRGYALMGDEGFLGDLFGDNPGRAEDCFVLEGLLETVTPDGSDYEFTMSDAFDRSEPTFSTGRVPRTDEDRYLKALAVVMCGQAGRVVDCIIQRLPSRHDQILFIPPL